MSSPVGHAEAPGRVVFVIGSPRSGTSVVAALLAAHPEIAGAPGESHLFDQGVNTLFDNFESTEPWQTFLSTHVSRPELVALARQLCDGVFDSVRRREKPDARFVTEKTPYGRVGTELELDRKLECYPDAWYLHVIRDGRAVVRSLRHMPWYNATTEEAAANWRRAVEVTRGRLSGAPRYLELRYERLVADPESAMREVYSWLGTRADAEIDGLVRNVMHHRFASHEAKLHVDPDAWRDELTSSDLAAIEREAGALLRELGYDDGSKPRAAPASRVNAAVERSSGRLQRLRQLRRSPRSETATHESLLTAFAKSMQTQDAAGLRALLTDDVRVDVRTDQGRARVEGEAGVSCLLAVARTAFGTRFVGQSWTVLIGDELSSLWFSGTRASGEPVDIAFSFLPRDERFQAIALLSPAVGGPLDAVSQS